MTEDTSPGDHNVRFENVGLRYGDGPEVLQDITFCLKRSEFYFLTGSSGAGKTSLLSLLYLALRPTRGLIELIGHNVTEERRTDLSRLRRRIGIVFQEFRLLDHLSAFDNAALPLRVAGLSERHVRHHVTELLTWVGLSDHLHAKPATLSGGQKQRVAIARAVINRPDLLVADEPTGSVDERTEMRLMRLFVELNKLGATVVIATHNERLVKRFHRPRLHLEGGRLMIHHPPYQKPPTRPA